MACEYITLKGMSVGCRDGRGGIEEVYINKYDNVKGITVDDSSTSSTYNMIKDISLGTTPVKYQTYKLRRQSSSMQSTLTTDDTTGTYSVQTDLTLQFAKMSTVATVEIDGLSKEALSVIVKDSNGKYWLLGFDNYVYCTAGTAQTGTAVTDANNYSLTLSDVGNRFPYEVDSSIISDLIVAPQNA